MSMTANQLRVDAALRNYLASDAIQVDERLPPFPELAKRIGTSVSVLQAVMPRLVAERFLEVVPRVGTFLRRRPDGLDPASHAGTALRFYVGEDSATVSPAWRRIVQRFEELHPGVCIEMSLSDSSDPLLRKPDILLINHSQVAGRRANGRFHAWVDEATWKGEARSRFAKELRKRDRERDFLPVLVGTQVLFSARSGQAPASGQIADLLAASAGQDGYGLVITSFITPMWNRGLGAAGIPLDDPEVLSYLRLVESVPAPRLVLPSDFADGGVLTKLAPLVGRRCRFFFSSLWTARFAERGAWDLLPPPGDGPVECGAMCLMVAKGPNVEAATALARFIAEPEGQRILGEYDALLPTWRPAMEGHRYADLFAAVERRGFPPKSFAPERGWEERYRHADRTIAALRVHRASVGEAMAALVAVDRG